MKRALKAALWMVNYELWRYNIRLTYRLVQQIRAAKEDERTWGNATDNLS